jgi:hypothetical protein
MLLYLVLTSYSEGSVNDFMALARLNGYFVLVQSAVFTNGECDKGCEKRVSCPLTPCLLIKCFLAYSGMVFILLTAYRLTNLKIVERGYEGRPESSTMVYAINGRV